MPRCISHHPSSAPAAASTLQCVATPAADAVALRPRSQCAPVTRVCLSDPKPVSRYSRNRNSSGFGYTYTDGIPSLLRVRPNHHLCDSRRDHLSLSYVNNPRSRCIALAGWNRVKFFIYYLVPFNQLWLTLQTTQALHRKKKVRTDVPVSVFISLIHNF